jgi:hypothetical protein
MHRFRDLDVYKKSIRFTRSVRDVCRGFPISENIHQHVFQEVDGIIAMLVGLQKSLQR